MNRLLSKDEELLWAQVTATVTPMDSRRSKPIANDATPPANQPPPIPPVTRRTAAASKKHQKSPPARPQADTLDRSWERRLSSGRTRPDLVLDLHGLTQDAARRLLKSRILQAHANDLRVILVITGKGDRQGPSRIDMMQERPMRGVIRSALPQWLGEADVAHCIAAVRRAHPRHGGHGAVYLILRRRRS